jgi:hypothetical protein
VHGRFLYVLCPGALKNIDLIEENDAEVARPWSKNRIPAIPNNREPEAKTGYGILEGSKRAFREH